MATLSPSSSIHTRLDPDRPGDDPSVGVGGPAPDGVLAAAVVVGDGAGGPVVAPEQRVAGEVARGGERQKVKGAVVETPTGMNS